MKRLVFCAVSAAVLALGGCSGVPARLDNLQNVAEVDLSKGERLEVTETGFQLFHVFPIGTNDRHARAMAALREQAAGRRIADVRVMERWYFAVFGNIYSTTIEATAYPVK